MTTLRTDTLLWNQYKIADLRLDLPFCKIYRIFTLVGGKSCLLIDFDPASGAEKIEEETKFWISSAVGIFPEILQTVHDNGVYSIIVSDFHGIPIRTFVSMGISELPEEKVFSLLPDLVYLLKKMKQVGFIPESDLLLDRICFTTDQHLVLIPALLSLQFQKSDQSASSVFKLTQGVEEVNYVQAFGKVLCYFLTQVFPKGSKLPEKASACLKEDLEEFLQAVLAGKIDTLENAENALSNLLKKRSEKPVPESSTQSSASLSWIRGTQERVVSILLPGVHGLKFVFDVLTGFLKLIFFLLFLTGSYYWEQLNKTARSCKKLYKKLRHLTWVDVKKSLKSEVQRARIDFKNVQISIALLTPVSDAELLQFTRHLATMLDAGVSFSHSLKILHSQAINLRFKNALATVYYEVVQKGSSLSMALRQTKAIFPELYINMVAAGEVTGKVGEVLHQVADYLEKTRLLKQKIKAAVTYPIIICIVCFALFSFFVYVILPNLMGIFEGLHIKYPLPTKILIAIVKFAHSPLVMLISLITAVILFFPLKVFLTSLIGRERLDQYKTKIPLFGKVYKKVLLTRFCSTLGVLIRCGIPLLNSLETTGRASGNEFFNTIVSDIIEKVRIGLSLTKTLEDNPFFPPLLFSMVQIGEESGNLEETLLKVANIYQGDVEHLLQQFLSLLEPLLLAFMGLVVGFVVLAVFEPIYAIASGIH